MTTPKLDVGLICDLCDGIKADMQSGCTDREVEKKAQDLLLQIASWRRGFECELRLLAREYAQ